MNIHHLVPSVSRWLLSMGSLILAIGLQQPASGEDLSKFRRIEPQFIATLGVLLLRSLYFRTSGRPTTSKARDGRGSARL
jgi:hypothetical protein